MPQPAASARLESLTQTREVIIRAARDIVSEQGWQGAHVALIAARAGVATGSLYRYFESKGALFAQMLQDVSAREVEVLKEHIDGEGSASHRLAESIATFVRRALRNRKLAYAMLAEPCEPEIDAARLRCRAAIAGEVARALRQGIASGEFADVDVNVAASCVAGAFMESLVGPLATEAKPDTKAAERAATTIAQLCTRMVAAPIARKAR
jgi:AcrR family transcriptional regulator